MIEETVDKTIYKKIPLHVRIVIRLCIIGVYILNVFLNRHGMSPSFSIYLLKKPKSHLSLVQDEDEGPIQ